MLTKSYVHGASQTSLIGETIGACFDQAAERWSDREALVVRHQSIRWTCAELKRRVDALAAGLLALDLMPGDRVGIWSPNNAEWVVTQFATAKAGFVLVKALVQRGRPVAAISVWIGCRRLVARIIARCRSNTTPLAGTTSQVPAIAFAIARLCHEASARPVRRAAVDSYCLGVSRCYSSAWQRFAGGCRVSC